MYIPQQLATHHDHSVPRKHPTTFQGVRTSLFRELLAIIPVFKLLMLLDRPLDKS